MTEREMDKQNKRCICIPDDAEVGYYAVGCPVHDDITGKDNDPPSTGNQAGR